MQFLVYKLPMKTEYVKYHTFLLNWLHAFSMEELLVILFRNSI